MGRSQQCAIGDGQADHESQATFSDLDAAVGSQRATRAAVAGLSPLEQPAGERIIHLLLEAIVLLASLSLFRAGDPVILDVDFDFAPRFERGVHGSPLRVQIAISVVQIPVHIDHVADIVANRDLEVGLRDVRTDSRHQNTVVKPRRAAGAGNTVVLQPST